MNKKVQYFILFILLLIAVIVTYSNHFGNGFHFDDSHTITTNIYIRDIGNFAKFFTEIKTFGSMPNNLGFRPVVTATTAIDYWMGNGLNPFYFHLSMFIIFLFQGICMILLFRKIFNISYKHEWTKYLALFGVGLYLLHPGIAETINYVIARSDLLSTFFMVLAFVFYAYSKICRKYFLYLIPITFGVFSKEPTAMFPLLLFVYILFFENKVSLTTMFTCQRKLFFNAIVKVLPALIYTVAIAFLVQYILGSQIKSSGVVFADEVVSGYHLKYILTQPYVLFTYFSSFFLPVNLSSDPEFLVFNDFSDYRMYIGFTFMLVMFVIAFAASKNEKYRPISFGILWFFIAAIPTSVIAALSQVANSHRLFFPYVGLCIAVCWAVWLLVLRMQPLISINKFAKTIILFALIVLSISSYATFQRNKVWRSDESLWYDIMQKNPANPRALMNYGIEQMKKGNYKDAETYFTGAIKIKPYYTYAYVNLGILKAATGDIISAENYYRKALLCGDNSFPSYYFAKFLYEQTRYKESIEYLKKSVNLSSGNTEPRMLLMRAYYQVQDWENLKALAEESLQIIPQNQEVHAFLQTSSSKMAKVQASEKDVKKESTPDYYLNLSLTYYQQGLYDKSIEACKKAIAIKPNFADAYNNIGACYNQMRQWKKAMVACKKALEINPAHKLAQGNLNWAKVELAK